MNTLRESYDNSIRDYEKLGEEHRKLQVRQMRSFGLDALMHWTLLS